MRCLLLSMTLLTAVAWGDAVVLNDGRRLEGELKRDGSDWVVTDAQNHIVRVSADDVKSIELGRHVEDASIAKQRLEFLKRYTDTLTDPALALARYEEFLKQYAGTPQEAGARKELELWRSRQQQGMVKVGGQWLGQEELARWDENAAATLQTCRQLIKEGRLKDAGQALQPLLAADASNPAALYLQGVAQYGLDQLPAARKSFESALVRVPDHAGTLNNLAAICWRQKQQTPAIALLDRAASNLPGNQRILDNMAEVLSALPDDAKASAAGKHLAKRYEEQEPELERAFGQGGWYRWGSTWVNKTQYDELQKQQREVSAQLDELSREYDRTEASIAQMSQDIDANERTMRRIEVDSVARDAQGNLVRMAYPSIYYDLQRETDRLTGRRRSATEHLGTLKDDAQKVRAKYAVPPFSGVLQIMDETYMPQVPRKHPATAPVRPATGPASAPVP